MHGNYVVVVTEDGSHSVRHTALDVTYHSMHGAIQESRHVFISAGLEHVASQRNSISVLEVGLGTGLNAFLTYLWTQAGQAYDVLYTGVEQYPLPDDLVSTLNYCTLLEAEKDKDVFLKLHKTLPFGSGRFHYQLLREDILNFKSDTFFDLVYFDAFDPSAQPVMWTKDVFSILASVMHIGAVLVTYCAQGEFRRTLKACGFQVDKIPGPPGKREIVRATRLQGSL